MLRFYTAKNRGGSLIEINDGCGNIQAGKEGAVYPIPQMKDQNGCGVCAKIFIKPQDQSEEQWKVNIARKQEKIEYMVQNQPVYSIRKSGGGIDGYSVFAWPFACLYEENGNFKGYLMPKCDNVMSLTVLFNPQGRKENRIEIKKYYEKYTIAYRLCAIFHYMHMHDIYGIDGNPENFLFHKNNYLFTLIDTDSFQLQTKEGKLFENHVGFSEIMPPEYNDGAVFDKNGDCYILAFYLFKILMDNLSPFNGRIMPEGVRIGLSREDLTQKASVRGCFAFDTNQYLMAEFEYLKEYEALPMELRTLFSKSFTKREHRTTAEEWMRALDRAMKKPEANNMLQNVATKTKRLPQVRYPILLLMDVTPSLTMYQDKLINGFQTMLREMQKSSVADAIELSLLEFAEEVDSEYVFAPVGEYNANLAYGLQNLRGYTTRIDRAVDTALQKIHERKQYYERNAISYKKPKIVLMTDAIFYQSGDKRKIEEYIKSNPPLDRAEIICVAIGKPKEYKERMYQENILKCLASGHSIIRLNQPEQDLKSIFHWISSTVTV